MNTFTHRSYRCLIARHSRIGGHGGSPNHALTSRLVWHSGAVPANYWWQRRYAQSSSHDTCDDFVCVDGDFAPLPHRVGGPDAMRKDLMAQVQDDKGNWLSCTDERAPRSRLGFIQKESAHDVPQSDHTHGDTRTQESRSVSRACGEARVPLTLLRSSLSDTTEAKPKLSADLSPCDATEIQQSTPPPMTAASLPSQQQQSEEQQQHLPYDDDKFAETLLQMQVDGAIDEAWQDRPQACFDDVAEIVEVLKSMKVRDLCCIDVSAKTCNFDYMMIGTCEGARHIHLAAWAVQEADTLHRITKVSRKHTDEQWEVVTIGRIVINLIVESLREELSLERKWAVTVNMDALQAANSAVSEGRQVKSHGLWTLTLNLQDLEDFEVDYCKDVLLKQF